MPFAAGLLAPKFCAICCKFVGSEVLGPKKEIITQQVKITVDSITAEPGSTEDGVKRGVFRSLRDIISDFVR